MKMSSVSMKNAELVNFIDPKDMSCVGSDSPLSSNNSPDIVANADDYLSAYPAKRIKIQNDVRLLNPKTIRRIELEFLKVLSSESLKKLPNFFCSFLLNGRYNISHLIDGGSDGNVFYATDNKMNKGVAMKVMRVMTKSELNTTLRDVTNLSKLLYSQKNFDKSFIIKINDCFRVHNRMFVSFDLLGPNLFKAMELMDRPFNSKEVRKIMYQLFIAVRFLHKNGVIHTDIKTGNILLLPCTLIKTGSASQGTMMSTLDIKLIDFDQSVTTSTHRDQYEHIVTTTEYRAPEILLGLPWDKRCDMWSIGCTIFELCYRQLLFSEISDDVTLHLLLIETAISCNIPSEMCKQSKLDIFTENKGFWSLKKTLEDDYPKILESELLVSLHQKRQIDVTFDGILDYIYEIMLEGLLLINPGDRRPFDQLLAHPLFKRTS